MFAPDILRDKIIVITGGGTGLGRAMGERFLELGAKLTIASRKEEVLKNAAAEMSNSGGEVFPVVCDVRSIDQVERMIDETIARYGKIDILVNNAAGNFISPTEDLTPNAFKIIVDIVLMGSINCTLTLGKKWIAQRQKGVVLNILTTYASAGSGYVVPSACAKAGVEIMTKSLAVEWGKYKIRFVGIAPGPFPTPGAWDRIMPEAYFQKLATDTIPLGRVGQHIELANLAAFLISEQAEYITGETIRIDGGLALQGTAGFNWLSMLSPEQWADIKKRTRFGNKQ